MNINALLMPIIAAILNNGPPPLPPLEWPRIIPWVECNWPDAPIDPAAPTIGTHLDRVVVGLRYWRLVSDTAIVSTRPYTASLYPELRKRAANIRIIPGLKPNGAGIDLLPRLDSVDGWSAVAHEIITILLATNEATILIDAERAVYPFIRGTESIDMDRLARALSVLPNEVEYLWFPSVFGAEVEQLRSAEVCRVVEDILANVRFLDQCYQGKGAVSDPARIAADRYLKAIAKRPTLRMMYFYGPDYHRHVWWRDEQITEALTYVARGPHEPVDVVIYPGYKRWADAARMFARCLPHRSLMVDPTEISNAAARTEP